jgi:hypothetical protein
LLNSQQKIRFEGNLKYTKGRFESLAGRYSAAKEDLLFALYYGNLSLKPLLI